MVLSDNEIEELTAYEIVKFMDEPENIESLEIFAELIVQECLEIVEDERHNAEVLTSNPMQSCAIIDAKCNIKSHFGIK